MSSIEYPSVAEATIFGKSHRSEGRLGRFSAFQTFADEHFRFASPSIQIRQQATSQSSEHENEETRENQRPKRKYLSSSFEIYEALVKHASFRVMAKSVRRSSQN